MEQVRIKYSRNVDILLVWLSDETFDHADESDGVIARFSADGKSVLLEIQGAKRFLLNSLTSLIDDQEVKLS